MLTSNLFLLSLALLIVVVCTVLGTVVYFAAHGDKNKAAGDRKIVRMRTDSLRNAFRQAVELIEGNIASRAERYNVPWILVLNEGEDPRALPIAQSGVASVLSSDAATPAATQGIAWQFYDRGIVIDIKTAYLGSPDEDTEEKPWDEFLSLCRNYRPQRPFDSVVVTVPAAMLLAQDADARLELVRHAKPLACAEPLCDALRVVCGGDGLRIAGRLRAVRPRVARAVARQHARLVFALRPVGDLSGELGRNGDDEHRARGIGRECRAVYARHGPSRRARDAAVARAHRCDSRAVAGLPR
jgi:hypothetical protein